ncbi:hypothetical protein BC332_31238 [Capsicum chinense]|nr:hypothetical protein BC332_31238 [Capsicum chinense]
MLEKFPNNIVAENIYVAIDFLLVFFDADVSNHVDNDGDKTSGTGDIYSMRVLEKTKDLKAPVNSYYKSLKFTPSQFQRTFGGLRFLDSLLSKLNETAGLEGGVEEKEDDDDSILDYDDDDEDEEATLAEIEKLFRDLFERNGTML